MKFLYLLSITMLLSTIAYTQGCTTGYVDPTFQLNITQLSCAPNSGAIEVTNLQNGQAPFSYKLVETNTTNATGIFTGLTAGLYTIEVRDACGTVRGRQVTLVNFSFTFEFIIEKLSGCNDGRVTITTDPATAVYDYAVVTPNGDTIWSASPVFTITLYKNLKVIVRDACGNIKVKTWSAPPSFFPYIAELQHRLLCDKLDIFPVYYGFNSPTVCLYNYPSGTLVQCKQAPAGSYSGGASTNFFNIPYGQYYVIVQDACHRDSMYKPNLESSGGIQIDPYDWDCNFFKMHVDGPPPPASWYAENPGIYGHPDSVCLFRADGSLVGCKSENDHLNWINPRTGVAWESGAVWDSLPYGTYYAYIFDPCMDSTFRVDSIVKYPFKIYSASTITCSITSSEVFVNFDPGAKRPYTVDIYYPDGTQAMHWVTIYNDCYIPVRYNGGGTLMVVAADACGNKDTSYVVQAVVTSNMSINVIKKCVGQSGANGSGDALIKTRVDYANIATPTIISKDGAPMTMSSASQTNTGTTYEFLFPNLSSGIYIVRYALACGATDVYDTFAVEDYVYPTQFPIVIKQCGNNPYTFKDSVVGGIAPFMYEIIGSSPAGLVRPPQSNSSFTIVDSIYSDLQIRAVDVCGNSSMSAVTIDRINGCFPLPVDVKDEKPGIKGSVVKVYPNPSDGKFTIAFSQKKKSDVRIEIINASGIKVYQTALYNVDKKEFTVNENLAAGFYIISVHDVKTGQHSTFKQIVK